MWLSNCELRTNFLNLFKGVTAVISVGESDKIPQKMNNRKQSILLVLLRAIWYQGVITMQEVLSDVERTMTLILYLSENTVGCD
jgi:hypothetical protein